MFRKQVFELALALFLLVASPMTYSGVWDELSAGGPCADYRPMTEGQLRLAQSLFEQALRATQISDQWLAEEWSKLGYGVVPVPVPTAGDGWIGLRDVTPTCRGQGIYLINRHPQGRLVVQAPHAYHDVHTGEIAGGLLRSDVAILAWNSAKRSVPVEGADAVADLARRRDSLFMALTLAVINARPQGRLIQIHGFDNDKRTRRAGAAAAVIVSNGTRWSSRAADLIAACLQPVIDGPVLVYPRDVSELGATENVLGQTMRSHGHQGFVHLELNRSTREHLRSARAALSGFSDCFSAGLSR